MIVFVVVVAVAVCSCIFLFKRTILHNHNKCCETNLVSKGSFYKLLTNNVSNLGRIGSPLPTFLRTRLRSVHMLFTQKNLTTRAFQHYYGCVKWRSLISQLHLVTCAISVILCGAFRGLPVSKMTLEFVAYFNREGGQKWAVFLAHFSEFGPKYDTTIPK